MHLIHVHAQEHFPPPQAELPSLLPLEQQRAMLSLVKQTDGDHRAALAFAHAFAAAKEAEGPAQPGPGDRLATPEKLEAARDAMLQQLLKGAGLDTWNLMCEPDEGKLRRPTFTCAEEVPSGQGARGKGALRKLRASSGERAASHVASDIQRLAQNAVFCTTSPPSASARLCLDVQVVAHRPQAPLKC